MSKLAIFLADGCEEIEALTVVDLLRRADILIDMVNISDADSVTGSHRITIKTDLRLSEADISSYDGIVLPGGMPGTEHLRSSDAVLSAIRRFFKEGKLVSAICAAPTVLGTAGILSGKKAICYPGMEDGLTGAVVTKEEVVTDGNLITSRGMGTAIPFGLALLSYLKDPAAAEDMAKKIVFRQ